MKNGQRFGKSVCPFSHSNQKHPVLHVLLFQFGEQQPSGKKNMVGLLKKPKHNLRSINHYKRERVLVGLKGFLSFLPFCPEV